MNASYYFNQKTKPTEHNLAIYLERNHIKEADSYLSATFNDESLILDEEKTNHLEYKHLLNLLITKYHLDVAPKTFNINDNNVEKVISCLPNIQQWILKPSLLNNGQGIFLFDSVEALYHHFCQTKRYGGEHVLQEYIRPHLLNGHKYTFRFFVILTGFNGAYLYPEGYFNVAKTPYENNFDTIQAHITNEHLNEDDSPNVYQIPTQKLPNFEPIFNAMLISIKKVLKAFEHEKNLLYQGKKAINFFGVDFLLDINLKPWLIEFNHGPCFPTTPHPLQEIVYEPFWQAIVTSIIQPMISDTPLDAKLKFIKVC